VQYLSLFLFTVSDARGLGDCGAATLVHRLHLSAEQFAAAHRQA
jgi:hypothetical protein